MLPAPLPFFCDCCVSSRVAAITVMFPRLSPCHHDHCRITAITVAVSVMLLLLPPNYCHCRPTFRVNRDDTVFTVVLTGFPCSRRRIRYRRKRREAFRHLTTFRCITLPLLVAFATMQVFFVVFRSQAQEKYTWYQVCFFFFLPS